MNHWQSHPLLLASGSPRRKELLEQAGFQFRVGQTDVDETLPEKMPVGEAAEFLAIRKGKAALDLALKGEIILAADSVVILDDLILDKPGTRDQAYQHLMQLADRSHEVMSGICLLYENLFWSDVARTVVHFGPISPEEAWWYIDHGQPYDKAGGYGIQEWIGLCKVTRIEGNYSTVLGLPVHLVYTALQEFPNWSKTDQG